MNKFVQISLAFPLLFGYTTAFAQSSQTSLVPNSGLYFGLGLGLNATKFNGQMLEATGISTVTNTATGAFVSSGTAGGPPVEIGLQTAYGVSPAIQAGYFEKLKDSDYLWGVKFSYGYLGGTTATNNLIRVPQFGSYSNGTPFTGNAIASSYQKTVNHQLSLIPYFGQAFEKGTVYFGVGPTLSQVSTKINNLVGFADLNGVRTDISGTPQNFSANQWVLGGAVMLGGTYHFNKSWFMDISYTYSVTQNKTASYYSTFNNPSSPNTYSGSLIGSSTGTATNQSINFTINKIF
jgi:opacity protein-like surface antigen